MGTSRGAGRRHPEAAQRAAAVAAAADEQRVDIDRARLCAAAGCASSELGRAGEALAAARRRAAAVADDAAVDRAFDVSGAVARGLGTRGARAREAVLERQARDAAFAATASDDEPAPPPALPDPELRYEDFALDLVRAEAERRGVPCPDALVPMAAVEDAYLRRADCLSDESRRRGPGRGDSPRKRATPRRRRGRSVGTGARA